jgi:hypothetical protein
MMEGLRDWRTLPRLKEIISNMDSGNIEPPDWEVGMDSEANHSTVTVSAP